MGENRTRSFHILAILAVGLIAGIIYILLVPPWQHYDEPTHFEYAALIARLGKIPDPSEISQPLRREIASSMIEHRFFDDLDFLPELQANEIPIWIGVSQLSDPPLYYLAVSLPLSVLGRLDVTSQLYLARVISLAMFLGTGIAAYFLVSELTQGNSILAWLIAVLVLLLPAFTDLMTSVSNDVGIIFSFSLFLLFGVRLVLRGYSLTRLIFLLAAAILCIGSKSTGWIIVPMLFFLLILSLPGASLRLQLGLLGLLAGLVLLSALAFGFEPSATRWYRRNLGFRATQLPSVEGGYSPFGRNNLEILNQARRETQATIFQPLSPRLRADLRGKTVTLGGWVWSNQPTRALSPAIWIDGILSSQLIEIDEKPRFYALTIQVPDSADQIQVNLLAPLEANAQAQEIHFDGIVLTEGAFSQAEEPVFGDPALLEGSWADTPFVNLVQNPSFEKIGVAIPPSFSEPVRNLTNINVNYILSSMQDLETFGSFYRLSLSNLFKSFWARFGWNHVGLASGMYWLLLGLTVLGTLGALGWLKASGSNRSRREKIALLWLGFACVLTWLSALTRVEFPFWGRSAYFPGARYAYPSIAPMMLLIGGGLYWLLLRRMSPTTAAGTLIVLFIFLDFLAIVTLIRSY